MAQPPNPQPTSTSASSWPTTTAPAAMNTSTSSSSSAARSQKQPSRTTSRSTSMPAAQAGAATVAVQLTAQAKKLQPVLVSVLTNVGEIEKDFQAQEEKLAQDKEEWIANVQSREEELQAWQHQEQYKLDEQQHQLQADTTTFKHRMEWEKERIQKETQELNRMRTEGDVIISRQEPVTVEVGGDKYRTELSTLAKCKDSIFPNLVRALERREEVRDAPNKPKRDPYIFIDRDGKHFKFILNFLRQGEQVMEGAALRNADVHVLRDILYEVRYYQVVELERLLIRKMASLQQAITFNTLIMDHMFAKLTSPPSAPPLQYKYITVKDLKLNQKNLSGAEFNQVVFDHPVTFEGCLLVKAVFKGCCFNNLVKFVTTDLTEARFENCHCEGVQLSLRFCFENSIREGMEFEPPLDTGSD